MHHTGGIVTRAAKAGNVCLLALLLSVGFFTQVSAMEDQGLQNPTTLSWAKKPMNKGNVALTLFPNPQTNPEGCGRQFSSFLCDPDQVLSAEEANQIDDEIRLTCQQTTCSCSSSCQQSCQGYAISVAITTRLPPGKQPELNFDTQMTRLVGSLRTSGWQFGSCGDGTVIVLSTQDTQVFTSSGEMANQIWSPGSCVQKITRIIQPHLRSGHFGRALLEMIRHYRHIIQLGYCGVGRPPQVAALKTGDDDSVASNKSDVPPPPQDSPEESSGSGLSGAQIAGIVIGAVVGAAIILGLVLYCCGFGDSDPESNAPYVKPSKQRKQANRRNVRYKPQSGHHSGGGGWTGYDTGTAAGYVAAAVVIGGASDWGHDDDRGGDGGGGDWGGDDAGGGADFGD